MTIDLTAANAALVQALTDLRIELTGKTLQFLQEDTKNLLNFLYLCHCHSRKKISLRDLEN
jgi:hypothetical protein